MRRYTEFKLEMQKKKKNEIFDAKINIVRLEIENTKRKEKRKEKRNKTFSAFSHKRLDELNLVINVSVTRAKEKETFNDRISLKNVFSRDLCP